MAVFTRQDQVNEIIKCGKDPTYFINKYVKIQHPTRGSVPFATYKFQDGCVEAFLEHRLNIVLKSRQLGLSTVCAAYAVWMAIFQKDKNILVIATKLKTAMNFIKKVTVALNSLPKWLLLPKFEPSKQQVTFSNGSQIQAIPTASDAGRSEALSLLIIDEAAFIRDFDEIWTGLSPTFSTGGRAIILSTPNGVGGQYYKLWIDAEAGVNGFNPIKIMWHQHPEHDQAWFDSETRSLPKKKIAQEYLCDFIASGDTFLQSDDLEHLRTMIKLPVRREGPKKDIWIWKDPEVGHKYVISADAARGDARDFSTFHVIDVETGIVCAEYMGKMPPEKLADMIMEWGKIYNTALAVPENNTFGYFVCEKLKTKGYKRLFYHANKGDPFNYIPVDESENPGFTTNSKTRPQILSKLEEMIRNKKIHSFSQRLYDQLQAFVWNGNKPEALKDNYDDLVMSISIGAWLVEGGAETSEHNMAIAIAMLKASTVDRRDQRTMPGGIDDVVPIMNHQIMSAQPHNVHRAKRADQAGRGFASDFRWLYR